MSADVSRRKAELRRQMREQARGFPAERRAQQSACIVRHFLESPRWASAQTVLLFMPMVSEPDIQPLLRAALGEGKRLALPRHVSAGDFYEPAAVGDLERDLQQGPLGIWEPGPSCPRVGDSEVALTAVPGLAFDLDGWRLGRGRGYYDRLLAPLGGVTCGVAFEWQIAVELPHERHDIGLTCIVTPAHWVEVDHPPRH